MITRNAAISAFKGIAAGQGAGTCGVMRQRGLQYNRIWYSEAISTRKMAKQPDKLLELLGVMRL